MSGIAIVGGGFAGFNAALAAARVVEGRHAVTLVSRDRFLTMRPRLYERDPATLRVDLRATLDAVGVRLVEGEVEDIDAAGRQVALLDGRTLGFDRAVLAAGSVMGVPAVAGAEACRSIDDYEAALAFDRHLATVAARPGLTLAVVGAGFTGLELALELRDRVAAHAGAEAGEAARIVLVDRAGVVGPELGEGPRPIIEAALAAARVELRLGAAIERLDERRIALADGSAIVADAVVLCTGLRAAPLVDRLPGDKDRAGRLMVDAHLRAPASPGLFVAGDAACAETAPGRPSLLSCQHALTLGKFAGENAARDLLGMPLLRYEQARYVTCLSLGRGGAVLTQGWERAPLQHGEAARAIKVRINTETIYPPKGSRAEILAASMVPTA